MTIITSKEQFDQKIQKSKLDLAQWKVVSFEYMKNKLKSLSNKKELCIK